MRSFYIAYIYIYALTTGIEHGPCPFLCMYTHTYQQHVYLNIYSGMVVVGIYDWVCSAFIFFFYVFSLYLDHIFGDGKIPYTVAVSRKTIA